jgi:hypothetical protein
VPWLARGAGGSMWFTATMLTPLMRAALEW